MGRESSASQMLLYGKNLLFLGELFDFEKEMNKIDSLKKGEVEEVIKLFDAENFATATVGPMKKPLVK